MAQKAIDEHAQRSEQVERIFRISRSPITKPTVIANVHREGAWWVIDLPGIGITQAAQVADIEHMAQDLVESLTGSGGVDVRIQFR